VGLSAAALFVSTASARPLETILRSHVFEICADPDNMPYSSRDGDRHGILADVGQAVAQKLGVDAKITWIPSREYLRKTQCDAVPAVAIIDGDPVKGATRPYTKSHSVLVVAQTHRPTSAIDDFRDEHVAVPSGSLAHHLMIKAGIPVWVRFLDDTAILNAVESGEADAGIVNQGSVDWYNATHPDKPLRIERSVRLDPSLDYAVAFGLRKADQPLTDRVDDLIGQMMTDGELEKIFQRYGVTYLSP
jgi:polar amino acid transport system substrate-binding protein